MYFWIERACVRPARPDMLNRPTSLWAPFGLLENHNTTPYSSPYSDWPCATSFYSCPADTKPREGVQSPIPHFLTVWSSTGTLLSPLLPTRPSAALYNFEEPSQKSCDVSWPWTHAALRCCFSKFWDLYRGFTTVLRRKRNGLSSYHTQLCGRIRSLSARGFLSSGLDKA